jgi:hypothetical protein
MRDTLKMNKAKYIIRHFVGPIFVGFLFAEVGYTVTDPALYLGLVVYMCLSSTNGGLKSE